MTLMTDFEIRANNIATAIRASQNRVEHFGYSDDESSESVSRVYGMFVTWLTACEESRHQAGSYTQSVIAALPQLDDPSWPSYILPAPNSTLKQRAAALWGIRIAFTHGDGDISLISNQTNKVYAADAANHLPGVSIQNNRIVLSAGIEHVAIRTMVQLRDILQ